jgi:hypothetical protein
MSKLLCSSSSLRSVMSRVRPLMRSRRPLKSNSPLAVSSSHTCRPSGRTKRKVKAYERLSGRSPRIRVLRLARSSRWTCSMKLGCGRLAMPPWSNPRIWAPSSRRERPVVASHSKAITCPAAMASARRILLSSSVKRANLSAASLRRLSVNNAINTRVQSVTNVTATCAPFTRSVSGTVASPKWPTPNAVAQITVMDQKNAPAIPKVAWQRAASHNSRGNTRASASNESQEPIG